MSRVPDITDDYPPHDRLVVTPLVNATDQELDRQGWWANRWGRVLSDNPYPPASREHGQWACGWQEAEKDMLWEC